jgi:N-dimethylarginine dimethylaminohydrolase
MAVEMAYDEQREMWFAQETPFASEVKDYWGGDWGVASEVDNLKAVLLRRPEEEIEGMDDPAKWRWLELMDPDVARAQHDAMAEAYRQHGAKVYYVEEMRPDRPNAMFMRDNMFMTPEGAILARQAIAARRGEEMYVAKALAKLGVPIVRTISGHGVFEGACALWVDRETVILGTGNRSNKEGTQQVIETLSHMGVRHFIPFPIPFGHAHVDGLMAMIDHDLAIIFPWQVPHDVWRALRERGIEVLEAPSVDEVKYASAVNFVTLAPRKVLIATGAPRTCELLDKHGVEIVEVDIRELQKGWGALHCMTAFLKRGA